MWFFFFFGKNLNAALSLVGQAERFSVTRGFGTDSRTVRTNHVGNKYNKTDYLGDLLMKSEILQCYS